MAMSEKHKSQAQKFRDLARAAECDEDESAFDEKLKRIASAEPPKDTKPKKEKPAK